MSRRSQQIEALFQQGQRLHGTGRLSEAEPIYRQVLAAAPRHAEALHALGALALQAGRADAAEALVKQAIALKPAAMFHLTRAHVLLALRRPTLAERACRLVLRARPDSAEAHQALGHALSDGGDAQAAIEAYRQALRLNPDLPDIRNNLGSALRQANRLEAAEQELRAAPPEAGTLVNLSSVQKERGAFDRAEATLRQALALAPGDPILHYNWSLLMLLLDRPEQAWAGWEQRFRAGAVPARHVPRPEWNGDSLGDRTLLVHPEQGLGDTIQFCRYLPAITGRVVFDAPPKLTRLLSSNPAMPPMGTAGTTRFDVVAPLLSLPARMTEKSAGPPYLAAEPERESAWRDRIGATGFRVGIAWQGFSGRHEDKGRSIPLTAFRSLALLGVRLISLQKGEGEAQIAGAGFPVETLAGLDAGPDAFLDTAAVMRTLDLVVTSDTAIPHLAGALGCPVWVALRLVPDWRWMVHRSDSPWYPTMRLFRQSRDGDWSTVFAEIAAALADRLP
ncbi:tetratricopeptide repeat protein [Rhodopila sp.]|uniref:tetratricopeptide repeat protein n=1 Tax=Rhodopila sp. TaxID=2480087 RepID=UPI003D0E46F6